MSVRKEPFSGTPGGRPWMPPRAMVILILPLVAACWFASEVACAADVEQRLQTDRIELASTPPLDPSTLSGKSGGASPSEMAAKGGHQDRTAVILWDEGKRMNPASPQASSGQLTLSVNGRTF
jgi:hypothetical protein